MRTSFYLLWLLIVLERYETVKGFCRSHRHLPHHCEKVELNKTDKVMCSGKFDYSYISLTKLKTLTVCNVAFHGYDPRLISYFQHLYRFTLIHSQITHFTHEFPQHDHLQILNLTHLQLQVLHLDTFRNLKQLKILDLTFNKLRTFGKHHSEFLPKLEQLHIRGNNFNCSSELKWILGKRNGKTSLSKKVVDLQYVMCGEYKFQGKPALVIMQWIKKLEADCPKHDHSGCRCTLDNAVWSLDHSLLPVITVDCAGVGFTQFPTHVPQNTTVLILNDNKISDVSPLMNNSWYQEVSDIFLDNNNISTVDMLERSDWLSSFRVFSLRGNNLSTIPTYAFDHAFEKNMKILSVYLSGNPWVCDCGFTPGFQELLRKFKPHITDFKDIRCAPSEYNTNSNELIPGLPLVAICRDPKEFPLSVWDLLNVTLVFLIVTLYLKFIYDYWVYKTTAQLPWIARKM